MVLGIVPAFQLSAFAQQSETEQTIDQIGSQVAEARAGDEDEIRQVLEQLADQIAENTSSSIADQAITQLGSQVAANREGQVSQSIFQLVQQQATAVKKATIVMMSNRLSHRSPSRWQRVTTSRRQ